MSPAKKEFTETMVARMVVKAAKPEASRHIENVGFIVAVAAVALYAISDFVIRIGIVHPATCGGIPWTLVILVGCLILPKTIGRATTGKLWGAAIEKFSRKDA